MTVVWVFIAHHALWLAGLSVATMLAPSVLRQRRPTGSALAWLLALILIPYVGVPLYVAFGGRKFRAQVAAKGVLRLNPVAQKDTRSVLQAVLGADIPEPARLSSLQWFPDGQQAYRSLLHEIESARRSIRIVTYVLGDDVTGRTVLTALARKATQGIEVRLLVDDLFFHSAPRAAIAALESSGGKVARFMPLLHLPFRGRANLRNHRKIAMFDGQRALLGGMNLAVEYMGPEPLPGRWRDLALLVEGTAVATLDAIFCSDWRFAGRETLSPAYTAPMDVPAQTPTGPLAQVVPSGPDRPDDSLYDVILQAAFGARERLWIATPYFVPDDALFKALELAARRRVDVRIVVPARSNHRLADFVAAPALRDLAAAGVDVRSYGPGMLHAKALLVDEGLSMVGSANFDLRSLYLDYEVALLLYGGEEARWLADWFEATCASAERGTTALGPIASKVQVVARLLAPLV